MRITLRSIPLNERSYDVAVLHQALAVLGLGVAAEEVKARRAGEDTHAKMRILQRKLNLSEEGSGLPNEVSSAAVAEALRQRGMTAPGRAFTVEGTVRGADGAARSRQRVLAFDVDLRGAGRYRDVQSLEQVEEGGGFEFLGQATTDAAGQYAITFYDWQFRRAERMKADVVVLAVDNIKEGGGQVLGRSGLVGADGYSKDGALQGVDVSVVGADGETEYGRVMARLKPFLKQSGVGLAELAASRDQVAFAAAELDLPLSQVAAAADAAALAAADVKEGPDHELLYGVGRQGIRLAWLPLHKKSDEELSRAVATSAAARIIAPPQARQVAAFLKPLRELAARHALAGPKAKDSARPTILAAALPKPADQAAFAVALSSFKGGDARAFWREHLPSQPAFKERPELVKKALLMQQLTALTGNHGPLVRELMVGHSVASITQILEMPGPALGEIVRKAGVPSWVEGNDEAEKANRYVDSVRGILAGAFPNQAVAAMVKAQELPIEKTSVARGLQAFLEKETGFDLARSRIDEFDAPLKECAAGAFAEAKAELRKMQRVFQVSTTPAALKGLLDAKLHSAASIHAIPRRSFVKAYAGSLGGEAAALQVHERAAHIATRNEIALVSVKDYVQAASPKTVVDAKSASAVQAVLAAKVGADYAQMFGSPDQCECEHCRSIYSPAAYLVELLRFLWRCDGNAAQETPLDRFAKRRPDILHLPLTCENANTEIPYLDLANEVMEHYTSKGSLDSFRGFDTGTTTAEELRASPQNVDMEAYRKLKDEVYPFTLPYHQPLDAIRVYGEHLQVTRHEAMKAMLPAPAPGSVAERARWAEALCLSEEEFKAITGEGFDGTPVATPVHKAYGLPNAVALEDLSAVPEFLRRSGLSYPELTQLVKTRFVNPHQDKLAFLERVLSFMQPAPPDLDARLAAIANNPATAGLDAAVTSALAGYNNANGTALTATAFGQWLAANLADVGKVITLYEPDSKCALDSTEIRTVKSVRDKDPTCGLSGQGGRDWDRMQRFLRLWRRLGWTIQETDLMLAALGEDDITAATIGKLEAVCLLKAESKLGVAQLAVLWGGIDTHGKKSLYAKLFLNKAAQPIDPVFKADATGRYFQGAAPTLAAHLATVRAAFRLRDDELAAILSVARVIGPTGPRAIDPAVDLLGMGALGTLYRHAVMAKALKLRVADFCRLLDVFALAPFSAWDVQAGAFQGAQPGATLEAFRLLASAKEAGFGAAALEYILRGTLPPDASFGLDPEKARLAARAARDSLASIEGEHPETPPQPLTADLLAAKLRLTFAAETVGLLLRLLDGTAQFEAKTTANLPITIPEALAGKCMYIKGSGRLGFTGVMSDGEQAALKALPGVNPAFGLAVDAIHGAPAAFLATQFATVLPDQTSREQVLLDHPAQPTPSTPEERLAYIYQRFVPRLKAKLRRDAVAHHLAALVGLGEQSAAILAAGDLAGLAESLAREGFSGRYYSDPAWGVLTHQRTDATVDFDWGVSAPAPSVPADGFSARWEAFVAPPASGEITFVVEVKEDDESFELHVDGTLVLSKAAGAPATPLEAIVPLNGARLHRIRLDYGESVANAGVRLRWKTATAGLEPIPAPAAQPAAEVDGFVALAGLYHRAAKLVSCFGLGEAELAHFASHGPDFGNLDFKALTAAHWRRLDGYRRLRAGVPQAQAYLTDVFQLAARTTPAPTIPELKAVVRLATAWDAASLDHLVDTAFALTVADFRNEVRLNDLATAMRVVARSGLAASTVASWGTAETGFDALHTTARLLRDAVRTKYEEADWLDIAGGLSDKLRHNQRQALVAHLLCKPEIQAWGAHDADGLFEYFLIDVQMGTCMGSSRIVQAHAAIQMFVNRCLLNLESHTETGTELGVSPNAIDKERWDWCRNYRTNEANRKVFATPENWLYPEWRTDRSEFFRELESYLVQNDITDRSVEQAFRNYLTSLNEVANLDVCGTHRENHDDGSLRFQHVFARTHSAPYKMFYRRWDQHRRWSPWERVPLDVRGFEGSGGSDAENGGVNVTPVVWKKRLFLFWPEFSRSVDNPAGASTEKFKSIGDTQTPSSQQAKPRLEVRLAWGEYVDGKWTAKQLTKEFVRPYVDSTHQMAEKDHLLTARINAKTQELTLQISNSHWNLDVGSFTLADIQAPVTVQSNGASRLIADGGYRLLFGKRRKASALQLMDDVYLDNSTDHRLLPVDTSSRLDIQLDSPFFFMEGPRTYFVRPVAITIEEVVKDPTVTIFDIPDLVDDSGFLEIDLPPGPDDYRVLDLLKEFPGLGGDDPRFDPRALVFTELEGRLADGGDFRIPAGLSGDKVVPLVNMAGSQATHARSTPAFTGTRASPMASAATASAVMASTAMASPMLANATVLKGAKYLPPKTRNAMGGVMVGAGYVFGGRTHTKYRSDTGLEFHTFYHPFSNRFVENLNRGGISRGSKPVNFPPGLMESDTTILSDSGQTFEDAYDPRFDHGYVQKPADFDRRTYYKENVCFDPLGANSLYNMELFFHAPLYIATRLSRNGKHAEAMKWFHYIYDPTTDEAPEPGQAPTSRYWKVPPFRTEPAKSLEELFRELLPNSNPGAEAAIVADWRDHPFDPHRVAARRPLAYMKHVVIQYVENIVAWGDSLFRQFTRESVNEALQLYVLANHCLGPRPETVPRRGSVRAETYLSLQSKWDDFSNALVRMENAFPYSSETPTSSGSAGPSLLGAGSSFYFCIPPNEALLETWDKAADRLYKIRHCQDIDGVERKLALFSPAIDPAALIQAASQGLSLGSILADLGSPPPHRRFSFLIQKANEFCGDVKALGGALLAALEKKDAEELSRLRASHETQLLQAMTAIRERNVLDASVNKERVLKAREAAEFRRKHYLHQLGSEAAAPPPAPSLAATLTADSQLPADTNIPELKPDVDETLVDSGESGVKLITKEKEELDKTKEANDRQMWAKGAEALAAIMHIIPTLSVDGKPLGVGAGALWGGTQLGNAFSAGGKVFDFFSTSAAQEAQLAAKMAGYIRREQDWTLQANLEARQIVQLDKEITSADIRIQVARQELLNHRGQIAHSEEVARFLQDKFTGQELYQWMREQVFAVHRQAYNLAFDLAKKAEKAFRQETGNPLASFVEYGYWDSAHQGLAAGEKLQLALRQMEKAYLEEDRRELEVTKSVSIARLDPKALVRLRETGKCDVSLPEEIYDLDFRGHYFRRIKSMRVSIPCVAGPHTPVSCTLRLLESTVRTNTSLNSQGKYEHENDEGIWTDDDRFAAAMVPVTAIATSTADQDAGMFEFNFRDERYLPFELAGAICDVQLELATEREFRQFDHSTISDVILHVSYTAREAGGLFKEKAAEHLREYLTNADGRDDQPVVQAFIVKDEFPTEWHRFLHPSAAGGVQALEITAHPDRFQYLAQGRDLIVMKAEVFARSDDPGTYDLKLGYRDDANQAFTSTVVTMAKKPAYGGMHHATLQAQDAGIDLEEIDLERPLVIQLKRTAAADYTSLGEKELDGLLLVLHCKLA